jgi:hypothetical protein
MKFKMLRTIVTAVLLIILCACSAPAAALVPSETPGRTDITESSQTQSCVDVTYLLSHIAGSGKQLIGFPALIKGADIEKDGCMLHIDRLEINPDYQPGSLGGELYLLNESEVMEDVKAVSVAYAEYDAKMAEIGPDFADYIAGFDDGAQFTVFMLGSEALFLSEITVP